MNTEEFELKIKPLIDVIEVLCRENGIDFLAEFKINKSGEIYMAKTDDMIMDGATILSQYQRWQLSK
jgi:hypothetical protein